MNAEEYMKEALKEAEKAFRIGEIPIGAVVVHQGEIVGRGHNCREQKQQVKGHAEMMAIEAACRKLKTWKLDDCQLYVTLEPCPMCAGTILQARISDVYYAAEDIKAGAFGGVFDLSVIQGFTHYPLIHSGLMKEKSEQLINRFFQQMRDKKAQ